MRLMLKLFYLLPVLFVLGVVGFVVYNRVTHQPPPVRHVSTAPFAVVPIGGVTANLFTEGPFLRAGPHGDDIIVEFRDAQGGFTNVGDVSLSLVLKAPGMVMDSIGRVFDTATPGQYRTTISPAVGGDWLLKLSFTNAARSAQATAPVKVL